ncbi:MAG: BspA family leucine-rich repeat surface protein, partial [Coriobacteriia bacterium]|nr:BspA family leucine-rich repeat surface protein [Coriobacteriia bacterium]
MASFVLAGAMILSVLGGASLKTAQASGPVGDVIFNYPYSPQPQTSPTSVTSIDWNHVVDHNDPSVIGGSGAGNVPLQAYEQAYTEEASAYYNGKATPDHVVLSNDPTAGGAIAFYGYGRAPYMDYVFSSTDDAASQGLSFTMRPSYMDFRSFSESGYLFDGEMTTDAQGATYYTGYAVILSYVNRTGDVNNPNGTATLGIYYLDHEPWNTETFSPGNTTNTRTLIATVKTGINNLSSASYRVSVEIDPATRAFKVYVDGTLYASVGTPIGGASGPTGFGFYTGYYAHDDTVLTRIRYEEIAVITKSSVEPPTPVTSQVNFEEEGTGTVIRDPESETGYVEQLYRIVQPQKITFGGEDYYLVSNSRDASTRSDIGSLRYLDDPNANVTTLYYAKASDLAAKAPEKNARVNNGEWSNGTTDTPVPVVAGDQIEYSITAYAPSSATPMMMQGTNGDATDTTWWGQSTGAPQVQKSQVTTVTFVDLPAPLQIGTAVDQFLAQYNSVWAGKPILKAWDATETDLSLNPDLVNQRVIAWVTANATGGYDLFIGGQDGVWMSSSSAASYLFNNFTNVTSIDLTNFHTDKGTNMSYMFASVGYNLTTPPTIVGLNNFESSQVLYTDYMFYQYAYGSLTPPTLDLTHLDTSNVLSTNSMFREYAYNSLTPPTLDLTHMDTSNVVYMSNMFAYFAYSAIGTSTNPVTLDLTHFNTANVTYMDFMFWGFAYSSPAPPVLDLTHFDTSSLTCTNWMFREYAYSATTPPILDLTHFDTSKVAYMSYMFYQYAYSATGPTPVVLDLSRFDVSSVTYVDFMFAYCAYNSAPFTLDLNWWRLGYAVGGTNMTNTFNNCRMLTTLNMQSANFSNATITGTSGVFTNRNANLTVTVNTTANRTWMLALSPAPPTVTAAGLPTGTRPAPLPVTLIPPLPISDPGTSGVSQTHLTDTIPAGLTIDPSSITGTQSDTPSDNAITWQIIGQSVFWSVPDTMFPATV